MWRKWSTLYLRYCMNALEYRSELFVWFILTVIPTVILILVWQSILGGQDPIKGYEFGNLIQYYMLVILINELTASHFENWWVRMIREGKIDLFFTRPFSLLQTILIGDIGRKSIYALLTLPVFAVTWLVMNQIWPIGSFALSLPVIGLFLLCLVFAFAVQFLLGLIIVMLGFWIEGAQGLEHFKWVVINLLSGFIIPVVFMPDWLRSVVEALPLKYMYAVPIGLLQGKNTLTLSELWYPLAFVIGLWLVSQLLWRFALKHYTSAGG